MSALIVFETVSGAKAAVSRVIQITDPLLDMIKEVTMAQNFAKGNDQPKDTDRTPKSPIPDKRDTNSENAGAEAPKFSFKPTVEPGDGADYESITLMRMRRIEKEKLAREIREQEEKEELEGKLDVQ